MSSTPARPETALVTGAGSGIGRATARRLAADGLRVALLGRTAEKLESVAREIRAQTDTDALVLVAHQESADDVATAVETARSSFGRIDVLVNSAAVYAKGSLCESSLEEWDSMLEINLRGPFLLMRAVVPLMRESGGGVVINLSSTLGQRPAPSNAAYSVSKAALVMATRCLALEEAPHGIRALCVSPGVVETPIHDVPERGEAFLEQVAAAHPLGRVGKAEEIAALIAYLAGPDAGWMTGTDVTIDGGISI